MGIAPILAPSLGSLLLKVASWRVIFGFGGFGILNIVLTRLFLHETLTDEFRNNRPMNDVLSQYWDLLKDTQFNYPAIGAGLLMGSMFVYISAAPELIMEGYGVTPQLYFSWIFGMNAAGFIGLTQVNQWLVNRYRLVSLLRFGAVMQVIAAAFDAAGFSLWHASLAAVGARQFLLYCRVGTHSAQFRCHCFGISKRRAGMASAFKAP